MREVNPYDVTYIFISADLNSVSTKSMIMKLIANDLNSAFGIPLVFSLLHLVLDVVSIAMARILHISWIHDTMNLRNLVIKRRR